MVLVGEPIVEDFGILGELEVTPIGLLKAGDNVELTEAITYIGHHKVNIIKVIQFDVKIDLIESLKQEYEKHKSHTKMKDPDFAYELWRDEMDLREKEDADRYG